MKSNRAFLFAMALFAAACAVMATMPAYADVLTIDSGNSPYSLDYYLNIGTGYTYDTVYVASDGTLKENFGLVANTGGSVNNYGTLNNYYELGVNTGGSVNNYGTLNSNESFDINTGGSANNYGTLNSTKNLFVYGGTLNNLSGGTLTNYYTSYSLKIGALDSPVNGTSTLTNDGSLTNNGTMSNYGTVNNNAGGTLTNYWKAWNYGTLTSSGTISNLSTFTNNQATSGGPATITIKSGGTLNNSGSFNNVGQLTIEAGGTLNNSNTFNVQATISPGNYCPGATLTNNGTINNSGYLYSTTKIDGTGVYKQTAGETGITYGSMSQGSITIDGGKFAVTPQSSDTVTVSGAITNNSNIAIESGYVTGGFSINQKNSTTQSNVVVNGSVVNSGGGTQTLNGSDQGGFTINQSNVQFTGTVTNGLGVTPVVNHATFIVNQSTVEFADTLTNKQSSTFEVNQSNVTFDKGVFNYGIWISDPSTLTFLGDFTNSGILNTSPDDTYQFLGTGTQTLNLGSGNLTLASLVIGGGVTLNITGTGTLTFGPTGNTTTLPSGYYVEDYTGTINPVPIPGALLLFAPGLLGIGLVRRAFRK